VNRHHANWGIAHDYLAVAGCCRSPRRWPAALLRCLLVLITAGCTLLATASVHADVYDDRRTRAGVRLFRSLLSAEIGIENKAAEDGKLHLLILGGEREQLEELVALLAPQKADQQAKLRGVPVSVDTVDEWVSDSADSVAGVFLAEIPSDEELERLIAWSVEHKVMLYSPFEGHVERGVMAGISIEAKVRPFLNVGSLEAAGLKLKPLYMKVAKVHR